MRLLPFLFLLASCGSSPTSPKAPCAGNIEVGSWLNGTSLLNIDASCSGVMNECNTVFSYTITGNNQVTISVSSVDSAPGCLPLGSQICPVSVTDTQMQLTCSLGLWIFQRQ